MWDKGSTAGSVHLGSSAGAANSGEFQAMSLNASKWSPVEDASDSVVLSANTNLRGINITAGFAGAVPFTYNGYDLTLQSGGFTQGAVWTAGRLMGGLTPLIWAALVEGLPVVPKGKGAK